MADEVDTEKPEGEEETILELTGEMAQEAEELIVLMGDEEIGGEEVETPTWVKELRRQRREDKQRIRDLEAKLATNAPEQDMELGEKPKLTDFDFDNDKYEEALDAWHERKREIADRQTKRQRAEQQAQEAWDNTVSRYNEAKGKLGVRDYDVAEDAATAALSTTQQGIILQGAERPELVIYALGRNATKLEELSGIDDPVRFAFAVAKLEAQLKTTTRKPATAPEGKIKGAQAPLSGSQIDAQIEKLRADAAKGVPGAMQKIMELRRQKAA